MTLKDLREARSLTQLEVAIKLGTTPGTISNLERGIQEPRLSQISALADLYGVTLDQMVLAVKKSKQP